MNKKSKKKKPEPFGQAAIKATMERLNALVEEPSFEEPTVEELMAEATRLLQQAMEKDPQAYYERSRRVDCFPALIPRRRKLFSLWHKKMQVEKILITGRGNVTQPDHAIMVAVEKAYAVLQERRLLKFMSGMKSRGKKYARTQLRKSPPFSPAIWREWKEPMKEVFMKAHNQHPEKNPDLRRAVQDANRDKSKSDKIGDEEYCTRICTAFNKAIGRFAKEQAILMGTN